MTDTISTTGDVTAGPLAGLARRLKEQFDPKGVLNPGRMG